ncbi:glycosyltransferase [Rhizobium sp. TRM95796]|uniref:glycosyltransferase n=1 Tax=Rhizobium sp. TRM95796 TaxID=2979862 RepID=UPI0021E8C5FD|nr:glycosyltransferase [Rhizobium sp. TRM95796]MCV3765726.1 glycosyltransferase [Rhizobium sp. TRM95796]
MAGVRKLIFYPDYTGTNPYQSSLYSNFVAFEVSSGGIDGAIQAVLDDDSVVFHLHWPEPIFSGAKSTDAMYRAGEIFLEKVSNFRGYGGKFAFTVHNVLPHDTERRDVWVWFFKSIMKVCDFIHTHNRSAIHEMQKEYEVPEAKCHVFPHGNYVGSYPMRQSTEEARQHLLIPEQNTVFGFVGQLRAYKGLEKLISSFDKIQSKYEAIDLLIAGKAVYPTPAGYWERMAIFKKSITVHEGFVPDELLQTYFSASDVIVLPYENILTSGSVMLSATFGKPVIAPALPTLAEIHQAGFTISYDPQDPDGLTLALEQFLSTSDEVRVEMRRAALDFAERFAWPDISDALETAMLELEKSGDLLELESGKSLEVYDTLGDQAEGQIAVAIVSYYSLHDVDALLESIPRQIDARDVHIYILCNGRSEREMMHYRDLDRKVVVLVPEENLGYAAGNNAILELALKKRYAYISILNPDMNLRKGCLERLYSAAIQYPGDVLSPAILTADGKISFAGGWVMKDRTLRQKHHLDGQSVAKLPARDYKVDVLNGCALFASADAFKKVGYIPEDYFLYYEETDWFLRMEQHGVARRIIPDAIATHHKASHGRLVPTLYYLYYFVRNSFVFNKNVLGSSDYVSHDVIRKFRDGWSERISKNAPTFQPIFQRALTAAEDDGENHRLGAVNVGDRLDAVEFDGLGDYAVEGYVETVDGKISGWVSFQKGDDSKWQGGTDVWLIVDDVPVERAAANLDRPDVAAAGYASNCGFVVQIPLDLIDGAVHKIELRNGIDGKRLPFLEGDCLELKHRLTHPAPISALLPIQARVDAIENGMITGWVYDPSAVNRSVHFNLSINERQICGLTTGLYREDLEKAGMGNGRHGFRLALPYDHIASESVNVRLYLDGETTHFYERKVSPKIRGANLSPAMTPEKFLEWAFINYETPLGFYQNNHALQRFFEFNKLHYGHAGRSAPQDQLISVIMPVYNRSGVVADAIQSVRDQYYQNWELLIVDDGSTDDTYSHLEQVLGELGDERIKLMRLAVNQGVSAARNVGLQACKGSIISYLDSDNQWYPEFLSIVVGALEKSKGFSSCYMGQEIWEYLPSVKRSELRSIRACPFNRSKLEQRNYIDLNVFAHRREIYEQIGGFRDDMRRLVDWEFILRATEQQPSLFVPVLMNKYFVGLVDNQITKVEVYDANLQKIRALRHY